MSRFHKRDGEYYRVLLLRTVGNFLMISALFMIGKTFYAPMEEEVHYFVDHVTNKHYIVAENSSVKTLEQNVTPKGGLAKLLNLQQVQIITPADPNFSIIIPKIGANARIIPNVDPANEDVYRAALKQGVAHALGTDFPGEHGHIFLFAHSTDNIFNVGTYNAIFYLLYKVDVGDEVSLFYKGKRYVYNVVDKKIVNPTEVEYLTRKTPDEFLTLQTCWPPGTTLQRLLVFAKRVAE